MEGLRRYGYNADADRISREFLGDVLENFQRDGAIREKYNVVTRSTDTRIQAGYAQNVVGFGWTNGVFLALLDQLHQLPGAALGFKFQIAWLVSQCSLCLCGELSLFALHQC